MNSADRYAALIDASAVREDPLLRAPRHIPELEIQARWFAGEFGREFPTSDGATAHIVQFGVWNREAGPDFSDAAVRIDGRTSRGCIEIDTEARDWEAHGHATNPAYENVVLHLCTRSPNREFFTRTASNRLVPRATLDLTALNDKPLTVAGAKPGRCVAPLAASGEAKALSILRAAARHRLRRKSARLAQLATIHGRDEAIFQSVAAALGYKHNKLPFTLLAQRLPLRQLLEDRPFATSSLLGISGFLAEPDLRKLRPDTRSYLRDLWEHWWRRRSEVERLGLPAALWRLSGVRPTNHPQRRIAALAALLGHWPSMRRFARQPDPAGFHAFCGSLRDEFWDVHYTLSSRPAAKRMALIGASRAADILANVLFPAAYIEDPACWDAYKQLAAPMGNRRVGIAATRLFGSPGACPEAMRRVVYQQGLLQIYEDFCMRDATDCARCQFPEQLAKW